MDPASTVLVTGAAGFIGRNLVQALDRRAGLEVFKLDIGSPPDLLPRSLNRCGFVFHLAGVNRPRENGEYERGNVGSLAQVLSEIERKEKKPLVILASSIQAGMNHPYGRSKLKAEQILSEYSRRTAAPVCIFRLPGVFGKWCRPDYNSVVATFCHNSARDLPIVIADPDKELELVHIDDVVAAFLAVMDGDVKPGTDGFCHAGPVHRITVGRLARVVQEFQASRRYSLVPDFSDPLTRRLYSTYVSYLPTDRFAYPLARRDDSRGSLAEVLKSAPFGQIFISRTLPGAVRGNHYHDRKVEKFIVLEGEAVIRFRPVQGRDILEYPVSGRDFRVVDIPPGYTHSIENIGPTDLVVLFWACEPYDPSDADTFALDVGKRESA